MLNQNKLVNLDTADTEGCVVAAKPFKKRSVAWNENGIKTRKMELIFFFSFAR